jgi:hypothetical protein
MDLEPVEYDPKTFQVDKKERLRLIGLILDSYVHNQTEEKCGERFDLLYEKTLPELRIYYQVYYQVFK